MPGRTARRAACWSGYPPRARSLFPREESLPRSHGSLPPPLKGRGACVHRLISSAIGCALCQTWQKETPCYPDQLYAIGTPPLQGRGSASHASTGEGLLTSRLWRYHLFSSHNQRRKDFVRRRDRLGKQGKSKGKPGASAAGRDVRQGETKALGPAKPQHPRRPSRGRE